MSKSVLDQAQFRDEEAAYAWVEARVWAEGRVCPYCGEIDNSTKLQGKSTRIGVYKCKAKECRKPFTVKVNTIFHDSKIPMHIWLQAMFLLASSKKGISTNQLHRTLGITLKSAWHLSHRIREAMKVTTGGMFGGGHGGVEADATFIGQRADAHHDVRVNGVWKMNEVHTLIDRDTGCARSTVIEKFEKNEVIKHLRENVAKEAYLLTDQAPTYRGVGREFTFHGSVDHSKDEYVSREHPWIHTNTVEGYFSIFKRGMRGIYQHCAPHHLHRYTAEFDFRYSNRAKLGVDDVTRFAKIVEGVRGKRLMYGSVGPQEDANA